MYCQPIEQVEKLVNTSVRKGLTSDEAQVRLSAGGKNVIEDSKKIPGWLRFLKQFKNMMIIILFVALGLELAIAIIELDAKEFISAGLILAVIVLNSAIGYAQETKAERSIEALRNQSKPFAKVIRNGKSIVIKAEDLVVGDVILLEAGDIVPADVRLVQSASLKIVESALTGESVPSEKQTEALTVDNLAIGDRTNMAFLGGTVVYGRGKGIVVATGMQSQIGLIAEHLKKQKQPESPLTKRLNKTTRLIALVVSLVAVYIFVSRLITGDHIFDSLMITIAIAVCAVPEALPTCISITMALGTQRMSKRKAIMRNLPAVETLGSTEIICSDKTGTITLNQMVVQMLYTPIRENEGVIKIGDNSVENKNLTMLANCMLLCNDARMNYEEDGTYTAVGDPTETALVDCAVNLGFKKDSVDAKYPRVDELPFDSGRKMMSTLNKDGNGHIMYTKGAHGLLLDKCTRILDNGKVRSITAKDIESINGHAKSFMSEALRVLGCAYKPVKEFSKKITLTDENDLIFIGLTGMIDPPRKEVYESIKKCKEAFIKVVMITGDHKDTAFAIAKRIGLCKSEDEVMTGAQLDGLSDDALIAAIDTHCVFARVNPEHKVRLVNAFKAKDKIVAMTGDGVNDAPSIKAADIGIGMGITGTDVTKQVADVILTDDNFATIVSAVEEGRRTYTNIKKVIVYLVGLSLAELVLLTLIIGVFRLELFNPIMILWINMVTDTLPVLALGTLPAEKNVMKQKPNSTRGSLFKGRTGMALVVYCIFMVLLVAAAYYVAHYVFGYSQTVCVTMSYLVIATIETIHAYNLYSTKGTIFTRETFTSKWQNLSVIASMVLAMIPIYVPFAIFQAALGTTALTWTQLGLSIGLGLCMIPLVEIYKFVIRRRDLELSRQAVAK